LSSAAARSPAATVESAPLRPPRALIWIVGIAILLTYFGPIGSMTLQEPDEVRYAEIPREMLESGDWVTPRLNYVKYFEKPPLLYWLTAINFRCFGISEFVARLWPVWFAIAGIVMISVVGRAMFGGWVGAAAAAILAATPYYFGLGQFLTLDMPLSALLTLALGSFWFAYTSTAARHREAWVLACYAATALAVLTKGPVAVVLTGGIIILFLLLQWNLGALRWLLSPLGILLFLAIALPWFVLVTLRNPEFLRFFVVDQHFTRYLNPNEHKETFLFFVPIICGGMLPWTAFWFCAPDLMKRFGQQLWRRRLSAATLYCLVWSGTVFLFFSSSGSKLGTYVLPMVGPLAILAGRFFERLIADGRADVLRRGCIATVILGVGIIVGGAVTARLLHDWPADIIVPLLYIGGGMLALNALAALACVRRGMLQASFVVLLLGVLAVQAVAISGRRAGVTYRPLGLAIAAEARADDQIVSYRHYVQAIPFYAHRRVVHVRGHGELEFGRQQGDQRAYFWDSDEPLVNAWASPRRMFLVINRSDLEPLRPRLQPAPREIAAADRKVVVVNF